MKALDAFLTTVNDRTTWMLVGSTATRLHGVPLDPGDVDILFHPDTTDETMLEVAESLKQYAAESSPSEDPGLILSTHDQPLVALENGAWLFGRWPVAGSNLELARIRVDVDPGMIVETLGSAVWECRQNVSWHGELVPIVPLEVQLATIVARGQIERQQAVEKRLAERGADDDLIVRAMRARRLIRNPDD